MGSAVSSVTKGLGGVVGGVAEGMTPKIDKADQSQLNDLIQQQKINQNSNQNIGIEQYGNAQQQLGQTQAGVDQANAYLQQTANASGQYGSDALAILRGAATGEAPSVAQAQLQSGKDQAIATQMAMANSGNLSQMIGGQKTAMDNAANLVQQAANQSAQVRANEMAAARQQYGAQADAYTTQQQQMTQNATNIANLQGNLLGTQLNASNAAMGQANAAGSNALGGTQAGLGLAQGVDTSNAQNQVQTTGGLLNGAGAALGKSDENSKENIQSDRSSRAKGLSDFFRNENKPKEEKEDRPNSPRRFEGSNDDDAQMKVRKSIKEGFMTSDKDKKENVKKDSLLHAFLDKLEPVTFDYKNPNGEMGQTPGKHMGIIAQDVEKAPGGASMVVETPEGKAIDLASAVGMLMSAATDAHDRVSSLEELFKSKASKK